MKNTGRRNLLDQVLDEYVMWGGPVVTRREALADCRAKNMSAREIDAHVFGRRSVEAPVNPEQHVAILRQIQAMGW